VLTLCPATRTDGHSWWQSLVELGTASPAAALVLAWRWSRQRCTCQGKQLVTIAWAPGTMINRKAAGQQLQSSLPSRHCQCDYNLCPPAAAATSLTAAAGGAAAALPPAPCRLLAATAAPLRMNQKQMMAGRRRSEGFSSLLRCALITSNGMQAMLMRTGSCQTCWLAPPPAASSCP
jgi:hypothetical protein